MECMTFTDGSNTSHFVGRKSLYKDKNQFIENCNKEYDWLIEDLGLHLKIENVMDDVYCRFFPKMPSEMAHLDLESGYTFCDKGRGAFEVYVIDIRAMKEEADEHRQSEANG